MGGSVRPEVELFTHSCKIFDIKGTTFMYLLMENGYPSTYLQKAETFHIVHCCRLYGKDSKCFCDESLERVWVCLGLNAYWLGYSDNSNNGRKGKLVHHIFLGLCHLTLEV